MKKQMKQTKNINIIFDKGNICSHNVSIATLEMLNGNAKQSIVVGKFGQL